MAAGTLPVQSDPTLLADIRRYGKFDPTGCYQCGSCTISCDLVSDFASFPRKSIRYSLLGLRAPLLANVEPWICHDCGDCSIVCPRQVEPRISMATLRRFLSGQYERSGLAAKLLTSRAWYFGSLASVAALVALLILGYHLWYVGLPLSGMATPLGLEHMFPIMTYYTLAVILFPALLLLSRVFRVWRFTMGGPQQPSIQFSVYVDQAWTYVYQSATHSLLRKCPEKGRWLSHWILALGTVMMLTIKVFALRWFQTDNIYPSYNPQRWLGYLAGGFIFYGIGAILKGRLQAKKEIYKETRPEDLVFPILLVLTACSGIFTHIFRYAGFALCAHFMYAMHVIIATPMLVIEMPFGKAAHMIYRPLALYFQAVKERAARLAPAAEVVPNAL
jgi:ferredoxin